MREAFQRNTFESRYKGIECIGKVEEVERYRLTPGAYRMDFGFREIGQNEQDWLAAASDNLSDREKPFRFDYEHPKVQEINHELFNGVSQTIDPPTFTTITERFNAAVRALSLTDPEFNTCLSDIASSRAGTCNAKSLLFGSLLKRFSNVEVQTINGQYGKVQENVTYPWGHEWLRVRHQDNIYLYDPMYQKTAYFEMNNHTIFLRGKGHAHFENLTPSCYAAGRVLTQVQPENWQGVRCVPGYNTDDFVLFVENDDSLTAQCTNTIPFQFEINSIQEVDIYKGAIRTGFEKSGMCFPIQEFKKLT